MYLTYVPPYITNINSYNVADGATFSCPITMRSHLLLHYTHHTVSTYALQGSRISIHKDATAASRSIAWDQGISSRSVTAVTSP